MKQGTRSIFRRMANYTNKSDPDALAQFAETCAALADPNRVRALLALAGGELCACQLIALLNLAPSTVSRHLDVLRRAGLVHSRKLGRWVHYRRPGEDASPHVRATLGYVDNALGDSSQAHADRRAVLETLQSCELDACRMHLEATASL
jgi:ArsR family transcriptional regulator, arsenate/arsenite/antimonite-responsive transcriptional repressor